MHPSVSNFLGSAARFLSHAGLHQSIEIEYSLKRNQNQSREWLSDALGSHTEILSHGKHDVTSLLPKQIEKGQTDEITRGRPASFVLVSTLIYESILF